MATKRTNTKKKVKDLPRKAMDARKSGSVTGGGLIRKRSAGSIRRMRAE